MLNPALYYESVNQNSTKKFQFLVPATDKNTALKGIIYLGKKDFSGFDIVVVSVDDMG